MHAQESRAPLRDAIRNDHKDVVELLPEHGG